MKQKIELGHPDVQVELVTIKTTGDKILDSPLSKVGGKGLFVKEIEEALLRREVDLAVHSMKDIPAELPKGLTLAAFPEREDPRDALISSGGKTLEELPRRARIGTGSLRRVAQLLHHRPDLDLVALRGNVDTRLRKLEAGELHAIVLAAAGLRRLGFAHLITQTLSPDRILPAIGQGALGLEVRKDDSRIRQVLAFLNHEATETTVKCERAFLRELGGGCQVPIAAFARLDARCLRLEGLVAELDGAKIYRDEITGEKEKADELGSTLARRLLDSGAHEVLEGIYGTE